MLYTRLTAVIACTLTSITEQNHIHSKQASEIHKHNLDLEFTVDCIFTVYIDQKSLFLCKAVFFYLYVITVYYIYFFKIKTSGVKPYKCRQCGKAFTQRCSLESHERKVHGEALPYGYKERRYKVYVCEDCGETAEDPEAYLTHLRQLHPNNPALTKCHDKRQFKFNDGRVVEAL